MTNFNRPFPGIEALRGKIVLIDVDGVVADTRGLVLKRQARFFEEPVWDGKSYRIPEELRKVTFEHEGFWSELKVMPGCVKAIERMHKAGADINFVSAPYYSVDSWHARRRDWLEDNFPFLFMGDWADRFLAVPATKKHLIRGDILIEDNAHTLAKWQSNVEFRFTQPQLNTRFLMFNSYTALDVHNPNLPEKAVSTFKWFDWKYPELLWNPGAKSAVEIAKNIIRCSDCKEVLESTHVHDWQGCECGTFNDGGLEYMRRGFTKLGYDELSEYRLKVDLGGNDA